MSNDRKLTYRQLSQLTSHLQSVIMAMTAINNGLVRRLAASETFNDADRDILNKWSLTLNDLHTGSEAEIMDIRSGADPAQNTARPKSH